MRGSRVLLRPGAAAVLLLASFCAAVAFALDAVAFHHPSTAVRILAAALATAGGVVLIRAGRELVRCTREAHALLRAMERGSQPEVVGGHQVRLIEDDRPFVGCVGVLRPKVLLSTGTISALTAQELAAVLEHERHHARRRDPARAMLARALVEGFAVGSARRLADACEVRRELAADRAALLTASPQDLAGALLEGETWPGGGVHEARVDGLLGRRRRALPASELLRIAIAVVSLVAASVLITTSTACAPGISCDGHLHPTVIAGVAGAIGVVALWPRRRRISSS
ncbi:M48 family metalloprotease [Conexibacter sp. W3-3-2]|uniref:M56 family metallopeptidase n=1 Tax=Conexibacter sp. W3-3-2 TaxID=2675227 RepID=UPI0012B8E3B6|nr:M56 family metallopeptidase [Conexibacter sp. W3-3-2]MTD47485.1 M48 family metalloprotease [Conexibacter sp. W3-3-2]